MTDAIIVKNLTKTYKTHKRESGFKAAVKSLFHREYITTAAVDNVSFTIAQGEIVGFIGQNGAGKSTTIKMLTGILYPASGSVQCVGFEPWSQRKEYARHLGAVFGQKSQLWTDLPAIDAFVLNKGLYSIPEKEFQERLAELVKLLRIEEVIKRPVRDLSLGERMKCELVTALLHNPKVLFLDEPTIGVDALAKDDIRRFLKELNRKYKTTIILTTHDMDDIEALAERVMIIDKGKLIYDGDIDTVKKKYVKTKTVEIEFSAIKDKRRFETALKKGTVKERGPNYVLAVFNTKKVSVPDTIATLMKASDVIDLSIKDPDMDDVVKEIYKGR